MNEQQIRLFGVQETVVRERLADILSRDDLSVTLINESGDIRLHLTAFSAETLAWAIDQIGQRLGTYVYSTDGTTPEQQVVSLLKEKGKTVAVAESCTGGLLASRLTNVPGCSAVFGTGVVSYSWDCKKQLLGVSEHTLNTYGAVSDQTALEMADGIRRQAGADIGIGITGEAGPQAAEDKPVGTVYVALADAKRTWVKELHLDTPTMDREAIRSTAASYGLDLLYRYVQAYPTVMAGGERHRDYRQRRRQTDDTVTKRQRFMAAILPWRGSWKSRLLKLMAWVLVLALLVFGVFLIYNRVSSPQTNRELQDDLAALYWNETSDLTVENTLDGNYPTGMRSQFRGLYDINQDIAGWVRVPETPINYPVTVYRDGYYTNHSFNDQYSVYGQPYFYEENTSDTLSTARVLAIRGNNTRDEQMFSTLMSYRRIAYLREHAVIEMNTLYTAARWEIFAVLVVDEHQRQSEFEYFRTDFADDAAFDEYITQLRQRSLFDSNAVVGAQDDILLLVTNAEKEYRFSGARLVVAARRLDGSAEASATYAMNYQVIMPQAASNSTTSKTTTTDAVQMTETSGMTDVPTQAATDLSTTVAPTLSDDVTTTTASTVSGDVTMTTVSTTFDDTTTTTDTTVPDASTTTVSTQADASTTTDSTTAVESTSTTDTTQERSATSTEPLPSAGEDVFVPSTQEGDTSTTASQDGTTLTAAGTTTSTTEAVTSTTDTERTTDTASTQPVGGETEYTEMLNDDYLGN